jgi:hypothetical protein
VFVFDQWRQDIARPRALPSFPFGPSWIRVALPFIEYSASARGLECAMWQFDRASTVERPSRLHHSQCHVPFARLEGKNRMLIYVSTQTLSITQRYYQARRWIQQCGVHGRTAYDFLSGYVCWHFSVDILLHSVEKGGSAFGRTWALKRHAWSIARPSQKWGSQSNYHLSTSLVTWWKIYRVDELGARCHQLPSRIRLSEDRCSLRGSE